MKKISSISIFKFVLRLPRIQTVNSNLSIFKSKIFCLLKNVIQNYRVISQHKLDLFKLNKFSNTTVTSGQVIQ